MAESLQKLRVDQSLDLRGMRLGADYQRAKAQLEAMPEDHLLELFVEEDGEALRRLPFALRADGHEIVVSEPVKGGIRLLVRKRTLL
jgi:TusA-related sulfurtransferase